MVVQLHLLCVSLLTVIIFGQEVPDSFSLLPSVPLAITHSGAGACLPWRCPEHPSIRRPKDILGGGTLSGEELIGEVTVNVGEWIDRGSKDSVHFRHRDFHLGNWP